MVSCGCRFPAVFFDRLSRKTVCAFVGGAPLSTRQWPPVGRHCGGSAESWSVERHLRAGAPSNCFIMPRKTRVLLAGAVFFRADGGCHDVVDRGLASPRSERFFESIQETL